METADEVVLVLPEEPVPVRLMNTIWADRTGVHDELRSCRRTQEALVATGLLHPGVPVSEHDRSAVREVRDALRRLARLTTGDARPTAGPAPGAEQAVRVVNAAAAADPQVAALRLKDGDLARAVGGPARSVHAALGVVAAQAIDLLAEPGRFRACHAPGCVLYFVQNHPRREWCSTTCGNRARAARHYRRHHPLAGPEDESAQSD